MNKKWFFTISAAVLVGIVIGCTDSTTETGSGLPDDGFIKGTVTTAREDGRPVTFTFEHKLRDYPSGYYAEYGSNYVYVYRAKDFNGTWNGDDYSEIVFNVDSLNQDSVNFVYRFYLSSIVALQNDTVMPWGMNLYNPGAHTLTNYHYNKSDGTVSGSFNITGEAYNGQTTTVQGSFKSSVRILIDSGD